MKDKVDIRPPVSIYEIFERLNYTLENALAEYFDNSSQSFKDNKDRIYKVDQKFVPQIFFIYYENEKKIQILDNCFGVEDKNIDRILKLNNKVDRIQGSRNEFGLGLKTASFWFGRKLKIISKCLENEYGFELNIDLNHLEEEVPVIKKQPNFFKQLTGFDYGTLVEVSDLYPENYMDTKKMNFIWKILSSKYRDDIDSYGAKFYIIKIIGSDVFTLSDRESIKINNLNEAKPITFFKPKFKQNSQTKKDMKVDINSSFKFNDIEYKVSGTVGILSQGSRDVAGLTLFRNKRSIIGDIEGAKYKPKKIFKSPNSFESLRIYGYLNVDDFPVNQQKDGFKWGNGLEDAFIDFVYDELTKDENNNIIYFAKTERVKSKDIDFNDIKNKDTANEIQKTFSNTLSENVTLSVSYIENTEQFSFKITDKNDLDEYEFFIDIIQKSENNAKWMDIEIIDFKNKKYNLKLDVNNDFFQPFVNDSESVKQIMKFSVFFAYAEIMHSLSCKNASGIRNEIHRLIRKENED